MKKIKYILTTITCFLLVASCQNDGGDSKINFQNGSVPDVQKIESKDSFINFASITSGTPIDLGYTVEIAYGEVSSVDIIGFYVKGNGTQSKATLESNVTSFPATFNLSQDDLYIAFDNLNSASDFEIGDKLIITTRMKLNNGTIINILNNDGSVNYGPNIASSSLYKTTQTYNVSCESNLGGTYSVISSGASTDTGPTPIENPITNYPYTVTITADGGGSYTMSDGFAGLYLLWYDIYGITSDTPGNFNDVCNVISGTFSEPFGTSVTITGSVNSDGTLTIRWENGFKDYGEGIYTKI